MGQIATTGTVPQWTLQDRLRKAREVAGVEQAEFARDIGVSRNTVNNYERGKVTPRRPVLVTWALRTGVPLAWLEHGDAAVTGGGGDGPGGLGLPRLDSNQQPSGYAIAQVIELPSGQRAAA